MSFVSRSFLRISYFISNILKSSSSPTNLRQSLSLKQSNNTYNLRSNKKDIFKTPLVSSKYGDLVFGNLIGNFCNKLFPHILSYNLIQLKCFIFSDFNSICNRFLSVYPKFDVKYDFFFYKAK